jgi:flagellar hook assembly protein FlgD
MAEGLSAASGILPNSKSKAALPLSKDQLQEQEAALENQHFDKFMQSQRSYSDFKANEAAGDSMKNLFTDPDKMLKLWLMNETRPNPFAQEQKDPMETFGKFLQSMLMQTQTDSLNRLKDTMEKNNKYSASALMGHMVEIESNKLAIDPSRKIFKNFIVPEEANAYEVEIKNAADESVYKKTAYNIGSGINQFTWEGVDNDGKVLPVGDYKITINLLEKMVDEAGNQRLVPLHLAVDLDGKPIENNLEVLSVVDRDVQFSYEIPEGLEDLEVASVWISNSKGHVVHKGEIDVKGGAKGVYSWNCLDSSGHRVPEDVYSVEFYLKDGQRKLIHTDKQAIIRVTGKVHGVEVTDKGEPNLVTSRIKSPLSTVKRIISENGL